MHLDSLKIKNFRILEDVEVKKLGHVNLIVGKNNSGKSTVLEALALLASGFELDTVRKIIIKRKFNYNSILFDEILNQHGFYRIYQDEFLSHTELSIFDYRTIFIGNDKISLKLQANPYIYKDEDSKPPERKGITQLPTTLVGIGKQILDNPVGYSLIIDSSFNNPKYLDPVNYNLFLNNDSDLLHHSLPFGYVETNSFNNDTLIEDWDAIALTDNEDLVVDTLRHIEPRIDKLAFIKQNNITRAPYVKLEGVVDRVPLNSMGEGIVRLLHIILNVVKARDGFLLIDEFENGLHYSVQPEVWRLIFELAKQFNIQVFATTHSWDCIESFAQVAKDREDLDGVLFRMGRSARKSDEGKVIATVYDEDELYYITKAKMEVR